MLHHKSRIAWHYQKFINILKSPKNYLIEGILPGLFEASNHFCYVLLNLNSSHLYKIP